MSPPPEAASPVIILGSVNMISRIARGLSMVSPLRLLSVGLFLGPLMGCLGSIDDSPLPPPPPPPSAESLTLQTVATGLDFPVFLTAPRSDQNRLFVVEKGGRIKIIRSGQVVSTPFLDISAKVSGGSEQGLLGLAFHPQYASNGRFVVYYTDTNGDSKLAIYHVSSDPDRADPASEQIVLEVAQPFDNHNGGMVAFGPDGRLYVGLGDGGSAGDPQHNGQNRANLLGKILRLTVNDAGEVSIPTDNPFASQTGQRGEIWAYGLRNPWRFSFDRKTGDLYIGDVGQSAREEVDVALTVQSLGRGANYGWSIMEGKMCYPSGNGCDQTGLTLPVLEYDHGAGCSITGGYVYRGQALPAIQGRYFYADYCQGWVRSFQYASGGQVLEPQEWPSLAPGGSVTSFGEDAAGELYIMDSNGRVAKFVAAQ